VLGLCVWLGSLTACQSADDPSGDPSGDGESESSTGESGSETGGADTHTWWRDVEPIVREKCTTCHSPGNIGPFSLESHTEFVAFSSILPAAIESGQMPPWLVDPDCNTYKNPRSLSVEQEELLLTYIAGGMPEGDPADAPPDGPPAPELDPDIVIEMPEPYTPVSSPDDYRCFLIPWPDDITEDQYVTGSEVYPGERSLVHHVITYMVEPANIAEYQARDDADPGAGYTCFGGPGPTDGSARWLGAWVPGVEPFFAPEGVGQRVLAGSMLIMQVHYHASPGNQLADRSSMGLELSPSVDRPAVVLPLADPAWFAGNGGAMHIPAGDPDVMHEVSMDYTHPLFANIVANGLGAPADATLEIWDGGLHMHLFGKRARIEVRDPGGGNETCIADVPEWDFNWQSSYTLEQPILLSPGRELHLQCWWDNSAENQPIVDGQPLVPGDLDWGDGTLDEMCLGIMYITAAQ
jgi:hypothetical protein